RLCIMMFLEFFIWGGWFVTLGSYLAANLHASGAQTALAYSTQSWGAIIAPFIVGLVADRYSNAERLLGFIHIAGASLLYALPRTPPLPRRGQGSRLGQFLGVDALVLLRESNFLVFFFASILICIPLAFYYQNANQFLTEIQVANATGKQTIGQMSEVVFMLLVPVFLKTFGMKTTLQLGMLAWACRYVLFALGNAHELAFLL